MFIVKNSKDNSSSMQCLWRSHCQEWFTSCKLVAHIVSNRYLCCLSFHLSKLLYYLEPVPFFKIVCFHFIRQRMIPEWHQQYAFLTVLVLLFWVVLMVSVTCKPSTNYIKLHRCIARTTLVDYFNSFQVLFLVFGQKSPSPAHSCGGATL